MQIHDKLTLDRVRDDYVKSQDRFPKKVMICCGTGCIANGADAIVAKFKEALAERKVTDFTVEAVKETGCHGFCEVGPLVIIEPEGIFYTRVKARDVDAIIAESIEGDTAIEKLLFTNPHTQEKAKTYHDVPFFAKQQRLALRNLGHISAESIDEYISTGGYQALAKVLSSMSPEQVIDEVDKANLRGRGGGGFPAGKKWRTCRSYEDMPRYVICNGDEGDPGAFMDRSICEGDPHAVLEGMIICSYAIDSHQGYIYVREEYPLAVKRLQKAIDQAHERGLLGKNILGSKHSFDIKISQGAGAFVCGESSALMLSVAGQVGEPRAKYIRSVQKGLYDKPTVLNNVETYANVPIILDKGADWYLKIGSNNNPGTKAFSLVGKVKNSGLIEVPMGITLREIIFEIGGGIIDDRPFKAVQTGGPSGGCLPESQLDLPVDFDSLTAAGSMMGSGGMIVMDDRTCMVDVAKYFLEFLVKESCGKCVPCREGLYQLHKIVVKISEGLAEEADLEKAEHLSDVIIRGSLCGLGKSGPNPFISTIRFFRDEYLTHIRDNKCPAGVCKSLITYSIIDEKCTGCMACISACAANAITGKKNEVHLLDQERCTKCGACVSVCRHDAILVE